MKRAPAQRTSLDDLATYREWLNDELLEAEGELTPEMERRLDQLTGASRQKIERIGLFILELEGDAGAIGNEEKRLADRRRAKHRKIAHLKTYLDHQMRRLGERRVEGLLCTVTLHRNAAPSIVPAPKNGVQKDLFAPPRENRQSRRVRGEHVRVG